MGKKGKKAAPQPSNINRFYHFVAMHYYGMVKPNRIKIDISLFLIFLCSLEQHYPTVMVEIFHTRAIQHGNH